MSNTLAYAKLDLVEYYGDTMLFPENKGFLEAQAYALVMWRTMIATSHRDVKHFVEFLNLAEDVRKFDRILGV